MVRIVADGRSPPKEQGETLRGWQVVEYGEDEVGKNDYQVVKLYKHFFTNLNELKHEIIWCGDEDEEGELPREPGENFWEEDDEPSQKARMKEFADALEAWDGKTPLTLKGRHPDQWGGPLRFEFKPKTWTAKLMWQ